MRSRSVLVAVALASAAIAHAEGTGESGLLYQLESEVTLPSTNSGWDYIKMEPDGRRLSLARDRDALTVFDMDQSRAITSVKNSVGANGPLLLPQYNRDYVAMTDGTLTVISQQGPDRYELLGTVSTRPGARMMFMDERNGKLYVVVVAYTIGKPDAQGDVRTRCTTPTASRCSLTNRSDPLDADRASLYFSPTIRMSRQAHAEHGFDS